MFYIRNIRKLRSKRGFTLVETSMSMVLLLILIATASGIILAGGNIFARNTINNAAEILGNDVYRFISNRLSCASSLYTDDKATVSGEMAAKSNYEQLSFAADGTKASLLRFTGGSKSDEYEFCNENRLNGFRFTVELDTSQLSDGAYIATMTVKIYDGEVKPETLRFYKEGTFRLYNMHDDSLWQINETDNLDDKALYISYTYID